MFHLHAIRRHGRTSALVLALCASFCLPSAGPTQAADLDQIESSLRLIPADAAFYSSMLRAREQIEIVAESKAWASLLELPSVQDGLRLFEAATADSQGGPAAAWAMTRNPQIQNALGLLADMFSQDVFFYGDADLIDALELAKAMNYTISYAVPAAEASGQFEDLEADEIRARLMIELLADNLERMKVPNLVFGFKIEDAERAERQLAALESLSGLIAFAAPELAGAVQRTDVDGHEFLVLTIDGSMVPLDEIPLDELEEIESRPGDAQKVLAAAKEMTFVVALGVRDGYLLMGIGDSTECLANLGQGDLLIDRPEFEPLAEFAGRRLTSVSYVSHEMATRLGNTAEDIDQFLNIGKAMLPMAELGPEMEKQITADAETLAEDLKTILPTPGAAMSFCFLTKAGYESYSYDWGTRHAGMDASQPLTLLQHVGGNPLLAIVGRHKTSPDCYDMLVRWVEMAHGYAVEFGTLEMSDRERQQFEQFCKLAEPLVKRFDETNRELLLPALADGQFGFVLDAKLKSKRFCPAMPKVDEPLPMLEPALIVGVSDAEALRQAYKEYQAIAEELVEIVREVEPQAIPEDYEIPWPEATEIDQGAMVSYALPRKWRVDKKLVPNAALSDDVVVLSISRQHSKRLLAAGTPRLGRLLNDPQRPLAFACTLNFAGVIDAATPWVDLLIDLLAEENLKIDDPEAKQAEIDSIRQQVHVGLTALKTFRRASAVVYVEDGVTITHGVTEIRDIE